MPMPAAPEPGPRFAADLRLTLLSACAPSVSLIALTLLYALGDRHCERGSGPLWVVWAVALALSLAACWMLVRAGRRAEPEQEARTRSQQEPASRTKARVRFMVVAGLMLNAVSVLLLAGFASPLLALRPCQ
jgi:type VI protein secretion system component VasK